MRLALIFSITMLFSLTMYGMESSTNDQIKKLLAQGASANVKVGSGKSLLHYVVSSDQINIKLIRLLLRYGADPNLADPNNETPLHTAAYTDLKITRLLLNKGANPNAQNIDGDTPLHCACGSLETKESCKIVQRLLKHNADPNKQDLGGDTPVHLALRHNSLNTVKLFFSN